jgi:multimeric flavodoxin WrbA
MKVVAIVGSYRKGRTIDSAVDAILAGLREFAADNINVRKSDDNIKKIYLLDQHIEFCTNCRSCTHTPGMSRGKCVQQDDLELILSEIDSADAVVLAAPVNFFNVTALFRRFMERLVGYAYWPWGEKAPVGRIKRATKSAALVTSSAMPGWFIPLATGAPKALKTTAKVIGAKPVGALYIGLSAVEREQPLAPNVVQKARRIGMKLAARSRAR